MLGQMWAPRVEMQLLVLLGTLAGPSYILGFSLKLDLHFDSFQTPWPLGALSPMRTQVIAEWLWNLLWERTHEQENSDPYKPHQTTLFIPGFCLPYCTMGMGVCRYKCLSEPQKAVDIMAEVSLKLSSHVSLNALENMAVRNHSLTYHPSPQTARAKGKTLGSEAKLLPSEMCFASHPLSPLFWDVCASKPVDSLRLVPDLKPRTFLDGWW